MRLSSRLITVKLSSNDEYAPPKQAFDERSLDLLGVPDRQTQLVRAGRALKYPNFRVAIGSFGPGKAHFAITNATGNLSRSPFQQAFQHDHTPPQLLRRKKCLSQANGLSLALFTEISGGVKRLPGWKFC